MFKLSKRDVVVASIAIAFTFCATGLSQSKLPTMKSSVFDWNKIAMEKTEKGGLRSFFDTRTETLDQLEVHVTTLNPGVTSHVPHQHPNEEMIIVKEGVVEELVSGEFKKVGAGSIIFQAPNQLHTIRNAGDTPATYFAIKWVSPGMGEKKTTTEE
jgi:XRE family transcriptional regulator, regulator of sulfur utilization